MHSDASGRFAAGYSEDALFDKLSRYARVAGRELIEKAVLLYLVLRDPATPRWAKATVVGALGYFIAPIDAVPDLLPGVGFTDDLGVVLLALAAVATSITPRMRSLARRTVERFLGTARGGDDAGGVPGHGPGDGPLIETEATVVSREPV